MNSKKDYRYERKFIIPNLDLKEIHHLIKHHSAVFSEIFLGRQVNNIYFDSMDTKHYHDNVAGHAQRIKVRIRWYGNTFGLIENPILEFKIKDGFLGKKKSFKLKSFNFNKNFCFDALKKEIIGKSKLPKNIIEIFKVSKPTLLNSYWREYFLSKNKKIRITVDKNLSFFKIKHKNNNFIQKISNKNLKIIELKYDEIEDEKIHHITQEFPFRLEAISKYIHGIDLLHL